MNFIGKAVDKKPEGLVKLAVIFPMRMNCKGSEAS